MESGDTCFVDNRNARGLDRNQQSRFQSGTGFLGHRVHPVPRMPGIKEIIKHGPLEAVRISQPFQRRPDCLRGEPGQGRSRFALGLGHDVGFEALRRIIFGPDAALEPGRGCRHEAR